MIENEHEFLPTVGLPDKFLSSLLGGMDYQNFSIHTLVKKIAEFRGRPIALSALAMPEQTEYGMGSLLLYRLDMYISVSRPAYFFVYCPV